MFELIQKALATIKLPVKAIVHFRLRKGQKVSSLALSDEDFLFLINRLIAVPGRPYLPCDDAEEQQCRSLCNQRVLYQVGKGYKVTWSNIRELYGDNGFWRFIDLCFF